jgi:hypothetical protein
LKYRKVWMLAGASRLTSCVPVQWISFADSLLQAICDSIWHESFLKSRRKLSQFGDNLGRPAFG